MWKIFEEEFRKIASRKIVWIGLLLLLAFVRLRIGQVENEYSVLIDGETFYGKEAIEKDKELTARYAGPLTEEKVLEFYDKYGFFYYDPDTRERRGNFCNQFMTEHLTNFRQIENEEDIPESIVFFEGEEWERNAKHFVDGTLRFDYVYGWEDLQETYGILVVWGLAILFIIGLSPVFAEEYTLKTADILLTTQRGKKSGIWMKAAAALCFAVGVYCAVTLYVWGVYLKIFGRQGLDASPELLGGGVYGYCPDSIGGFFLFQFGMGLAGFLLLTCTVLAVSAMCKNAFLSVVISLVLFLIPVVWLKILGPMRILGMAMTKAVTHFMVSMPAYLLTHWGFEFPAKQVVMHLVIAMAVGAVSMIWGYRRYRGYQG